ncbi:17915_t:CDS:2 [Cetraspora pellucida]|uniref:17915_t:CDS:1 n=1 Tax=Cetraspora pellucida TaxID=1433469 RepID=A0ACA9MEM9_9GLOM|nr:17915_t:CDS:2 [Cetraspora pellucida]
MADFQKIFGPFINLFSRKQIQAVLLAWLPSKLEPYFFRIIAVDMFMTTLIATTVTTLIYSCTLLQTFQFRSSLTVQIEYYVKELDNGSFIVQSANNKKYETYEMPDFNILPEKNQQISIEYRGRKFSVVYKLQENDNNNNQNSKYYKGPDPVPSIFLSIINNDSSPNDRLDRNEGNWNRVQLLSDLNGLETIVLDETQEILLKKELDSFVNDKEFYKRIGLPYQRGFLLYGKPGTGKTTLINAISSYLSRDLYYLNLKEIKNDDDMSAAFSSVPPNQIIVFEDVDA